uniref:Uncharacterized protein n=1 Tax=Meloidogyne enterolobii TaxID=390850 RepID=A0A6V7U837_MELEN|nr:unnamed protein product [Meloidogyne enterolobii]
MFLIRIEQLLFTTIFICATILLFNIIKVKSNDVAYQQPSTYLSPAKESYYDGPNEHEANLLKCLKELGEVKKKSGEDYKYSSTKKPNYKRKEYISEEIDSYERDFPANYEPAFPYEKLKISDVIYPLKHKKKNNYYPERKNDYTTKTSYPKPETTYKEEKPENNYENNNGYEENENNYNNKYPHENSQENYNNQKYEEKHSYEHYNNEHKSEENNYKEEDYQHKEEHLVDPFATTNYTCPTSSPAQQTVQLPPNLTPLLPSNLFQGGMEEPILIPAQPQSPEPQEKQPEPLPPNQAPPKEAPKPDTAIQPKIPTKINSRLNTQPFIGTTDCRLKPVENCSSRATCEKTGKSIDCSIPPHKQSMIFDAASQNCRHIDSIPECTREIFCINKSPNWYLIGGNCTRISYSCGLDKNVNRKLCDNINELINPAKLNECIDKREIPGC